MIRFHNFPAESLLLLADPPFPWPGCSWTVGAVLGASAGYGDSAQRIEQKKKQTLERACLNCLETRSKWGSWRRSWAWQGGGPLTPDTWSTQEGCIGLVRHASNLHIWKWCLTIRDFLFPVCDCAAQTRRGAGFPWAQVLKPYCLIWVPILSNSQLICLNCWIKSPLLSKIHNLFKLSIN